MLNSLLKEANITRLTKEEARESEAYVVLHKDNPDTPEELGSANFSVPYAIDEETKQELAKMFIPTERPRLTCFGAFDVSNNDLKDISLRCVVRNEHGIPISHATSRLRDDTARINGAMIASIRREVAKEVEKLREV